MNGNRMLLANRKHPAVLAAAATVVGALWLPGGLRSASGANYLWDPGKANTAVGSSGSGTWDYTSSIWYSSSFGDSTWANSDSAVFGGPTAGATDAYTVTLSQALGAAGLSFNTSGYDLTATSAQTLTVTGSLLQLNSGITASIGSNATVAYTETTATFTLGAAAASAAASGVFNIEAGGTLTDTGGHTMALDGTGTIVNLAGTLSLTGAGASSSSSALSVGQTAGSNVVLNVNGGTYLYNFTGGGAGLYVGNAGAGTVNLNSGTMTIGAAGSGAVLANGAASTGTFNLSGGLFTTPGITMGSGTGTFNFNGGTLQARAASTTFMTGLTAANVLGGGAVIDSNTFNISIGQNLLAGSSGTGGLTKLSAGVLTLTGANTYTGTTTISGGTLALGGTGAVNPSAGITVNGAGAKFLQTSTVASTPAITLTNGTLDGVGTVGSVTVGAGTGGIVTNGNGSTGTLTMSALTFSGAAADNLTILGGSSFTTPGQSVTNALTVPGSSSVIALNVSAGSLTNGTYDILKYGSLSGSTTAFSLTTFGLGSKQSAMLGSTGTGSGYLTLVVTGATDQFTGADGPTWQVGTTGANHNFKLTTTGAATDFANGDSVLFDDTATPTSTNAVALNLGSNVSPASTTFNNSNYAYTISSTGSFGINGSGGLVKNNPGNLTINTTNSYAGGTTINGGTITTTADANLGAAAGAVTLGGGTLEVAPVSSGGLVGVTTVSSARNIVLSSTTGGIQVDPQMAYSTTGTVTDGASPGKLNVTGGGTLVLGGATSYSGGTTVTGGTTLQTDANLGAANSAVSIDATSVLNFTGGSNVSLTNKLTGTGNVTNSAIVVITGDETGFQGTWTSNQQVSVNATAAVSAGATYVTAFNFANNFIFGGAGTYNMGALQGTVGNVRGGNSLAAGTQMVLSVGALNTNTIYGGGLNDSTTGTAGVLSLVKVGTGVLTLNIASTNFSSTSAYSGGTTVNGGTLLVDNTSGSGTGSGAVVVNTGGTLGGTGTINNSTGKVTINSGGTISPGDHVNTATTGTLNTYTEAWNAGGGLAVDTNGTNVDRLVMTGLTPPTTGTFSVNVFALNAASGASVAPGTVLILATDTEGSASPFNTLGAPAGLSLNVSSGVTVTGGGSFSLTGSSYDANDGGYDLLLTAAAPEPTSLLLAGLAAGPLVLGRRRRTASVGNVR
jgi:autotransporter-associated beta strand protein